MILLWHRPILPCNAGQHRLEDAGALCVLHALGNRDRERLCAHGRAHQGGFLRRALGKSLQLRYTPELQWQEDDSIVHGAHILDILSKLDIPEDTEDETVDHS
mgnify:CR=1 FL=1